MQVRQRVHDGDPIRYVFIDAAMYYVDERGERWGRLSEDSDTEDMRTRLKIASNNPVWLKMAVDLGEQLIVLARRTGEMDAWGAASGYYAGGPRSGPNRMASAIRAATGIRPPSAVYGPMSRPARGHWSVRRVFGYDVGPVAPCVAIWHLGFSENPQFWPRWCQAIARRATPPVLILPDSPILRELARAWNAGELLPERQTWRSDLIPADNGDAPYLQAWVSKLVEPTGIEIDGDRLASAISFLESHHQLKLSPLDLLADPVLAGQLTNGLRDDELPEWSSREKRDLERLRRKYEPLQRIRAWQDELKESLPTDGYIEGHSALGSVFSNIHTATRALKSGAIFNCLYSALPGTAPMEFDPNGRPKLVRRSEALIEWFRSAFEKAADRSLLDHQWFPTRERWHQQAFELFPGEAFDFYDHIRVAELALGSPTRRRDRESEGYQGGYREWYHQVFELASRLGISTVDPSEMDTEDRD
jgi:hypothetical protein